MKLNLKKEMEEINNLKKQIAKDFSERELIDLDIAEMIFYYKSLTNVVNKIEKIEQYCDSIKEEISLIKDITNCLADSVEKEIEKEVNR